MAETEKEVVERREKTTHSIMPLCPGSRGDKATLKRREVIKR